MKRADYLPVLLGKTLGAYYYDQVPQDARQWSVYAAEESLKPGVAFATEDEARLFLQKVLSSDLWRQRFPLMRQVDLSVIQKTGADGASPPFSRGGPKGDDPLRGADIEIHEDMLNEMVLLHELAHCVQPRYFGPIAPVSDDPFDAPPSQESGHGHDPYFQAAFVWLCEHFGTTTTHTELREAYTHFGYPPASEDSLWEMQKRNEYWAPLEVDRRAKIRKTLARDKPEFTAAYPGLAAKAADMAAQQVDRIPMGCRFGDLFMDLREFRHRVPKITWAVNFCSYCSHDCIRSPAVGELPDCDCGSITTEAGLRTWSQSAASSATVKTPAVFVVPQLFSASLMAARTACSAAPLVLPRRLIITDSPAPLR